MKKLKRILSLLAAVAFLLCGCRTQTEYTSSIDSMPAFSDTSSSVPQGSSTPSATLPSSSRPQSSSPSSTMPSSLPSTSSTPSDSLPPATDSAPHYYKNLSDKQRIIYDIINSAVLNMTEGLIPLGAVSITDVSLCFTAVRTDHPEYFWMPYSYITSINGNEVSIAMQHQNESDKVSYLCTKAQRAAMQTSLNSEIAKIKKLIPSGCTDYEAELILHDWLCERVTYMDTGSTADYTAYGAIVNRQAVCEGYARAMQLLCTELSIPCTLVCGVSLERNENHMWNKIRIGGEWYNLDVTWDDDDHNNLVTHRFFNITDSAMAKTHAPDPDFSSLSPGDFGGVTVPSYNLTLPNCTATEHHYAKQEGCTLTTDADISKTVIRQKLESAANQKLPYCEFYLSYDVADGVDSQTVAKNYALQNCINEVNSKSKYKITGAGVALTGRTFIVFLNYGG